MMIYKVNTSFKDSNDISKKQIVHRLLSNLMRSLESRIDLNKLTTKYDYSNGETIYTMKFDIELIENYKGEHIKTKKEWTHYTVNIVVKRRTKNDMPNK